MKETSMMLDRVSLQITHASISQLVDHMTAAGIAIYDLKNQDEITVQCTLSRKSFKLIRGFLEKNDAKVKVLARKGTYWRLKGLTDRPFLMLGIILLLLFTVLLPTRIFFVDVKGNDQLSKNEILEAAQKAGISFGVSRREIRSEKVKNRLLEIMPQLQWIGINTVGCTAVISVTERKDTQLEEERGCIRSIVAQRDGVIRGITVTKGNALCVVGQAVKAGETLVSAYTDCGLTIRAAQAQGEIIAETRREMETVIPLFREKKGEPKDVIRKFSLLVGKKRIKFYKDSGIYGTGCDKMYKEYFVTLPGGFVLPFALAVEQWVLHSSTVVSAEGAALSDVTECCGEEYLLQQMVAGKILSKQTTVTQDSEVCRVSGIYRCLEMIGRIQNEEISANYGEID